MGEKDKYTVIMSVYSKVNPEDLKLSIYSILNQTYKTNEFILIKDGMLTEKQNDIIKTILEENKELFKVIELEENMGPGFAYQKGLEVCSNKWAAIMDSDDFADKTKFEKQMLYLSNHEDIDVIGTNAIEFKDNICNIVSKRIMPETNENIIEFAHGRCPIIQPTAIFKVDSVIKAGNYQNMPIAEDYDLYIRMIKSGCKFYTYPEILYYVRVNDNFFKRRGGIKYLKIILNVKYKHYKDGFFTTSQFLKTFVASFTVALMPNFFRIFIYKKFLRN